ncbi:MAG: hypothetical protein Tsb002_18150 [Wenzhouxiangellaceae bacterium]
MTAGADAWARVGYLFDELADLSQRERTDRLQRETLEPELRQWLDRLLQAHDDPRTVLFDRTLDGIVQDLADSPDQGLNFIPEDLSGHSFGNWRAGAEIGRGGMAVVLHGDRADGHFEKAVAIKVLLPGAHSARHQQRFLEEIRILARLEHPHIARLIDGGLSEEGWPYLIMEYVAGQPITEYCERRQLDGDQRRRLWADAAAAVAHAHRQLVVHCDIKPSNVLVSDDGQVKLVDFGIAGLLSKSTDDEQPAVMRCSPAYAAPEQLAGEAPSMAMDVFALGALLYELLSGARIRDSRQLTAIVLQRGAADENITPPSQAAPLAIRARFLRGDGDAICMQALAYDPDQRYATVNAVLADVRRWRDLYPVEARSGGRAYHAGKWLSRNRWLAGGAMLAAVSLGIGSAVALWQAREARAEAALSGATRDFLLEMFNAVDPWRNQQQAVTANQLVDQAVERLPSRLNEHPGQKAEILYSLGEILRRMGRAAAAQPLHEQAVQLWRAGDHTADLHRGLIGMAQDRLDQYDFAGVEMLLDEVADNAPWPPQSAAALDARLLLMQLYTHEGRLDEQRQLMDSILAVQAEIATLPDSDELLSEVYLLAAETMENAAEYESAIAMADQAIAYAERFYGHDHPVVARGHSYRATTHYAQGRYQEAIAAMDQFIDIATHYYGDDHPETQWGLYTKSRMLVDSGRYREAITVQEKLVEQLIAVNGDQDPRLGVTYGNMAKAWRGLGRLDKALEYYALGLPLTEAGEPQHPKVGTFYTVYAQALSEAGETELAERYYRHGLGILENKLGREHPYYAVPAVSWADHLLRNGDAAQALTVIEQAYPIIAASLDKDSPQPGIALKTLGDALAAQGRVEAAREQWREALRILDSDRHRDAYASLVTALNEALSE